MTRREAFKDEAAVSAYLHSMERTRVFWNRRIYFGIISNIEDKVMNEH